MSDMDSDCDDVFSEGYGAADSSSKSSSAGDDDGGRHMINRKRRRGIIEKRRRDRINNSLSELRRLVPAAFEKQGSAKLEKAEILQMTVDHLRITHSKGLDPVFNFDPHTFGMDYHGIGFRECASEVARYLVGYEGLDLQDPLRLRLMSHLQCCSSQRDPWVHPYALSPRPLRPPHLSTTPFAARSASSASSSAPEPSPVRPYRPWGTEMAY